MEAVCLLPSEAGPDMVGGAPCVIEGSEHCGERGQCRCFCSGEVKIPEGVLSVGDMLEERQYNIEVSIYGQVRSLGELQCPCFHLVSGVEDVEAWYDAMVEEDGTQRSAVDVGGIENGDWVIVTGELRSSDGSIPGKGFWASSIEKMK